MKARHIAPRCCWCGHDVRRDLRPAYTSWGQLVIECISDDGCNERAWQRSCAFLFEGKA